MENSLANLQPGQQALIKAFKDLKISEKLIEMGCLPGEKVTLSKTAPFGCPISINISGYELSLRKDEADLVVIEYVA